MMIVLVFSPWKTKIYKLRSMISKIVEKRWNFRILAVKSNIWFGGKSWNLVVVFDEKKKKLMPGKCFIHLCISSVWSNLGTLPCTQVWCLRVRPNDRLPTLMTPFSSFLYKNRRPNSMIFHETHFFEEFCHFWHFLLFLIFQDWYGDVWWLQIVLRTLDCSQT